MSAASGGPVKPHRRPNKLLRRVAAGAMACALVAVLVVTGHSVQSERVVNVCSWGEYIDEDLITRFEEQTGIRVNYQTAESNEALYSLIKMGGADFDVIVPSDYMIARLIEEDMLAELDYSHIPNFDLIDDTYKNLSYDPENKYTVPYAWGTLGIIYNTTMVSEPITSWDAMFDPQYAGQVLMINNSRDALAAALLDLGYSINTTDPGQLEEAFNLLKTAKDSGVYQAFVMDEVFQKMEGGNAAIAMYYAGDYLTMLENNEDLAFVIPEEGSNWFVDAMCVLKDTQHMAEAEEWINFIASTDSNLANMDYIWYASPNREALEQYPAYYEEVNEEELDPEIYEIMAPRRRPWTAARSMKTCPRTPCGCMTGCGPGWAYKGGTDMIEIGKSYTIEQVVTPEMTARAIGLRRPGGVRHPVYDGHDGARRHGLRAAGPAGGQGHRGRGYSVQPPGSHPRGHDRPGHGHRDRRVGKREAHHLPGGSQRRLGPHRRGDPHPGHHCQRPLPAEVHQQADGAEITPAASKEGGERRSPPSFCNARKKSCPRPFKSSCNQRMGTV